MTGGTVDPSRSAASAPAPGPAAAECPRCGYSLRGVVEAWVDACPTQGRCGECGLEFRWSQVLGPDAMPRWFVECERRRWFSGLRTFVQSMRPWRFWQRIRMTMRVHWTLWTYPVRLGAMLLALGVVGTAARGVITTPAPSRSDTEAVLACMLLPVLAPFAAGSIDEIMDGWIPGWSLSGPVVRPGRFGWGYRRASLQSPRQIAGAAWDSARPVVQWALTGWACSVATFVVLPIVRSRAKVRWLHIHRAGIYGLGIAPVVAALCWAADALWLLQLDSGIRFEFGAHHRALPWEIGIVPVLLLVWWWSASRWYLRLERPLPVALSVTAVGSVAGGALHVVLMPTDLWRWLLHAPWV